MRQSIGFTRNPRLQSVQPTTKAQHIGADGSRGVCPRAMAAWPAAHGGLRAAAGSMAVRLARGVGPGRTWLAWLKAAARGPTTALLVHGGRAAWPSMFCV